ncbi:hypothetical protein [Parafrankia sp. EUN1f]|uniref:hypothetical protein n=1 Tax=Parafrankia sp. EUN1f TaxID=102897 RepID=UPI0001C451FC|nr:hypothetical protein [Parafrankia sp. EUN1f]EFC82839.1 hypothetical protein FrEUN1fDRAFT_4036 [Parafrankia sp. EUN1f]
MLQQVLARLERFGAEQDPAVVLAPEALVELDALLEMAPDPAADLQVAYAAGLLRWVRFLVLDDGDDQQELDAALALFAPLYQVNPGAVPDPVRALFEQSRPDVSDPAQAAVAQAVALLHETLRTGDPATLNTAIGLFLQAVTATPTNHPNRAGYLSNLGTALDPVRAGGGAG